jgi:hypothetical protein
MSSFHSGAVLLAFTISLLLAAAAFSAERVPATAFTPDSAFFGRPLFFGASDDILEMLIMSKL